MPSTRPDKVNLTILLIAIKEQRGAGMIELLILAQFSEDKGFPDGSYKRAIIDVASMDPQQEAQETRVQEIRSGVGYLLKNSSGLWLARAAVEGVSRET
jgi:hypothetical protein